MRRESLIVDVTSQQAARIPKRTCRKSRFKPWEYCHQRPYEFVIVGLTQIVQSELVACLSSLLFQYDMKTSQSLQYLKAHQIRRSTIAKSGKRHNVICTVLEAISLDDEPPTLVPIASR